eukprot:SM000034S12785  [mRNA]  locus=s34:735101:743257:- [translate_table: standard]
MGGPRSGGGDDDGREARAGPHAMAAPAEASSWSLASSSSSSPPPMLRADDGNEDADWETLDRQDFVEKAAREHEADEGGVSRAAAANSLTIVLVGRSGNGKSATGNSILNKKVFKSARSHLAVTSTCELAHVDRSDGRHLNVVDTPGLFDPATSPEYLSKEISRCIALAREGVHALLLVLSTRNRFTAEEMAAVDSLQVIFGDKVVDYMIIVFTGGDELEEEGQSLDDYLPDVHSSGPESLQALLRRCGDRKVVFDNKTKDPAKQERQTQELLSMVDRLVQSNGGQPYTNALFQEAKEAAEAAKEAREVELNERIAEFHYDDDKAKEMFKAWREEMQASHAEQLRLVTSMVEEGLRKQAEEQQRALREQQVVLEERLAREKVAREEAENAAKEEKRQANDELQRMKAELDELKIREATLSDSKEEKQQAHNDLQRMKAELDQLKQREEIRRKMDKELNRGCQFTNLHEACCPGLIGPATSSESLSKEITRCIALARDGLHTLLLVLSTRNRFTAEEAAAVDSLRVIFGDNVLNYTIIVFTGGDELEDSSDDYLSGCCESGAGPLEALLQRCGDRKFVLDNKTKDPKKQELQSQELLDMVERLVQSNGGQPYTHLLFQEAQVAFILVTLTLTDILGILGILSTSGNVKMLTKLTAQPRRDCQEIAKNAKASQLELIKRKEELYHDDVSGKGILQQMQALHEEQLHRVAKMVEEKQQALQAHQAILEERLAREIKAREEAERTAAEERERGGRVEEWMQEHCFAQLHVMKEQRRILQEVADTFGMQAILGNQLAMEKKVLKEAESNLQQVQAELDRVADTIDMQAVLVDELAMEEEARMEAESNLQQVQAELDRPSPLPGMAASRAVLRPPGTQWQPGGQMT